MKNPYRELEKRLGYRFKNRRLLATALVHPSFRFENDPANNDNQRLEFLGDAVLGMLAAASIYHAFEDSDKGGLTRLRSQITSSKALTKMARGIQLGDMIQVGKGEEQSGGRGRASNLTDALEAILGAAYLDGGIKAAEKVFRKLFMPVLEECPTDAWSDNPKGRLQEISQRRWGKGPQYRAVAQKGPSHARVFVVEVVVNRMAMGRGEGSSKREAETQAANRALEKMARVTRR